MSERALLMDVKRFAVHDGPGIRTTLFFKGCSLRCIWCHNPEGIGTNPQMACYSHKCISCGECVSVCPTGAQTIAFEQGHIFDKEKCISCGACVPVCLGGAMISYGKFIDVEEATRIAMEDVAFYGNSGGVTVSGGEPLLQSEFIAKLLKRLKREGIHTAVDTCGYVPWKSIEMVLPYTDMFLYDIKHMDSEKHKILTGQPNERIRENIEKLSALGAKIEVRIPLVPGANDDIKNLVDTGVFLSKLNIERVKVLPYHSMARAKYAALGMKDTMPHVESPTEEQLQVAVDYLRRQGANAFAG